MRLRALLLALLCAAAAPAAPAQPVSDPILVISRERVLTDSEPARALARAQKQLADAMQRRIDAVKDELSAEEQELADQRDTLPRDEFDARVRDFDTRVRRERRLTQRRAAALQNAFRRARQQLAEAMVPLLVAISRQRGARMVLDRDQILVAHPAVDVTEEVIELMNERVQSPALPSLEALEGLESETTEPPQPAPASGG